MCGHCRRVHDYDSDATTDTELGAHKSLDSAIWRPVLEIAGPTITELVRNAITDLSSSAFARSLHQPGTRSWERPTYNIDPTVCFLFWFNLDRFISTFPNGLQPLYIHAVVYCPFIPTALTRKTIFRLINRTIPEATRESLSFVYYRLRFHPISEKSLEGPFVSLDFGQHLTFTKMFLSLPDIGHHLIIVIKNAFLSQTCVTGSIPRFLIGSHPLPVTLHMATLKRDTADICNAAL